MPSLAVSARSYHAASGQLPLGLFHGALPRFTSPPGSWIVTPSPPTRRPWKVSPENGQGLSVTSLPSGLDIVTRQSITCTPSRAAAVMSAASMTTSTPSATHALTADMVAPSALTAVRSLRLTIRPGSFQTALPQVQKPPSFRPLTCGQATNTPRSQAWSPPVLSVRTSPAGV